MKVWEVYVGEGKVGACYCCGDAIRIDRFDCGHVQSRYDEGAIDVTNLRPICLSCNRSSGTMNLDVFKAKLNARPTNTISRVGGIDC